MSNETEILPALHEDSFDIVMRGYNRQQVDEYLTRTKQQIQGLEQRLAQAMNESQEARRQAEQLRRELADTKRQLDGQEPSYDELGDRLSQILKLADQEAASKRTSADAEAERVRNQAVEDAKRIVADAEGQVRQVETAATDRVDKLLHHHTDLVRRLTNVRDAVVELLRDEDASPLPESVDKAGQPPAARNAGPQPGPQRQAPQPTPARGAPGAPGAKPHGPAAVQAQRPDDKDDA